MTCTEIEYPRVARSRRSEISTGGTRLRLTDQEEQQLQNLTRIESGNNFDIQQQSEVQRVSNVKTRCDDYTCFSITVKPSHLSQRFCMTILVCHFTRYLKNQEERVVYLRGLDGRTWSVKYYVHIWPGKIRAQFSPDFKGFSAHHNLQAGDVCYFELVKCTPPCYQDLFAAGTDTTSNTLEWAMTELLRNPTKMKKAQEELQNVIGKDNLMDEKDISKLSYLSAVINETFRVHPPVPFLIPRKVMTNIDFVGFTVPMNSQVLVNVWAIGKDPNVWEDVNSFKPERFVGSKVDVKGLDFELTPFGAGRRICPGMPLAIRMLPMMLASLIHSFDWILEDEVTIENMDMEENFGITLHKAQPLMAIPIKKF